MDPASQRFAGIVIDNLDFQLSADTGAGGATGCGNNDGPRGHSPSGHLQPRPALRNRRLHRSTSDNEDDWSTLLGNDFSATTNRTNELPARDKSPGTNQLSAREPPGGAQHASAPGRSAG
jgi:hypothetical protein